MNYGSVINLDMKNISNYQKRANLACTVFAKFNPRSTEKDTLIEEKLMKMDFFNALILILNKDTIGKNIPQKNILQFSLNKYS